MSTILHATPLEQRHVAAGARLLPFAGRQMPLEYEGIRSEHLAVRESAGVFDVSHMGQIETRGPEALALLQRATTNDVAAIPVGGAQYGLLCREDGGVLEDLFTYRLAADRFLIVTNAANHRNDLDWIAGLADGRDVRVADRCGDYAMLAVQGPRARGLVSGLAEHPLPPRMAAAEQRVAGVSALVCGTGYTGEEGVELLCAPDQVARLWDATVAAGATPAGLGARDTLRLEACFHLYGNDLDPGRNPIEAGLGWCCKEATGLLGSETVAAARAAGTPEKLVAFQIVGPGIARAGHRIAGGGVVTSGAPSPSLGVAIGLAYVPTARSAIGTALEIEVRGRTRAAVVVPKPHYRRETS